MECLGRYTFLVMTSVILSGGVKMRVEHGMLTLNGDRAVEDEGEIARAVEDEVEFVLLLSLIHISEPTRPY